MKENIYYHHDASVLSSDTPVEKTARKEMVDNVTFRELQQLDLNRIDEILKADIVKAAYGTEQEEAQFREASYYYHRMKDSIDQKNDRRYTVAVVDEKVVGILGYMGLKYKTAKAISEDGLYDPSVPTAELVNFYVDPEYQHHGIGGKMWAKVHEDIVQDGFQSVGFLSTYRHDNMWNWYTEKQGYQLLSTEDEHFGHPCRWFFKKLEPKASSDQPTAALSS